MFLGKSLSFFNIIHVKQGGRDINSRYEHCVIHSLQCVQPLYQLCDSRAIVQKHHQILGLMEKGAAAFHHHGSETCKCINKLSKYLVKTNTVGVFDWKAGLIVVQVQCEAV